MAYWLLKTEPSEFSFERLVREVGRVEPASTRATIQAELETAGERIRWFGRSIVFFRSGE